MFKKEKDNPEIVKRRTTRKVYLPIYLMMIGLIAVLVFLKIYGYGINKMGIGLVIIFILIGIKSSEIHRYNTYYEANPNSLVYTEGVIRKKVKRIDYFAISDIDVDQGPWQRLLGYGDVVVRLFSKDTTTTIYSINKPVEFATHIEKMMRNKRKESIQ